ncbi:MAG: hypothetical protein ACYCYK_10060, partial [Candidatus Dormibacteria bacterium]
LVNLLRYFGTDLRGDGSPQLQALNRDGQLCRAHCHPGHAFWPQALVRLLHDLGVSRDEFWDWWQAGRHGR